MIQFFHLHINNLDVCFQASFIAELSRDKWEEADFLNHTVFISPSSDCHYARTDQDPIPWIIGKDCFISMHSSFLANTSHFLTCQPNLQ